MGYLHISIILPVPTYIYIFVHLCPDANHPQIINKIMGFCLSFSFSQHTNKLSGQYGTLQILLVWSESLANMSQTEIKLSEFVSPIRVAFANGNQVTLT